MSSIYIEKRGRGRRKRAAESIRVPLFRVFFRAPVEVDNRVASEQSSIHSRTSQCKNSSGVEVSSAMRSSCHQ
jgi:hypothetical protein